MINNTMKNYSSTSAKKYSLARVKIYVIWNIFVGCIILVALDSPATLKILSMIVMVILSLSIFFIRCEVCRTLIYRVRFKEHGMPVHNWHKVGFECPVCGVRRVGLFDWMLGKVRLLRKEE